MIDALLEIGADRICSRSTGRSRMSVTAVDLFDVASISENDRHKVGRLNAVRLFRL